MACNLGKGAQTMNSIYLKPMLRKAYHKKNSADIAGDLAKRNVDEAKKTGSVGTNQEDGSWWVRDSRTGIFYPKGQEKVMEGIPLEAGKDKDINWFSRNSEHI